MPASFEQEALKAQAIVARTYTIYKINNKKHDNADICDSSLCCQAWISKEDRLSKWDEDQRQNYWEKISNAVNSTKGKIITYNNAPINAFFMQIVVEQQKFQKKYGAEQIIRTCKLFKLQEKKGIHNIVQKSN